MGTCCSRVCPCVRDRSGEYERILQNDANNPYPQYVPQQGASGHSTGWQPSRPVNFGIEAGLRKITVNRVGVEDIDKQFKEHAEVFNDSYDRFNQLCTCYTRMLSSYESRGSTNSNLTQVFKTYKDELEDFQKKSIEIKRRHQYCMQLHFNGDKIPGDGAQMFEDFNLANLITKDITEKGPNIIRNTLALVNNEENFKQRIVDYYSPEQGKVQEKLQICVDNIAELKNVKPFMEYMRRETSEMFDDLRESIRVFAK